MFNAPQPDDLTPEDLELVPTPVATYGRPLIPRWQAHVRAEQVQHHVLVRRAAAAICVGNWHIVNEVIADAQELGCIREVLRAALGDLAELAIRAAKGDTEMAASYFENLLEAQRIIDAE